MIRYFKSILSKNAYLYDSAASMTNLRRNSIVSNLIRDAGQIDSIQQYDAFANIVKEYKAKYGNSFCFMLSRYSKDSRFYGHLDALYRYAGRAGEVNYNAFSNVEHGTFVATNGIDRELINLHNNVLLMGTYKSELIHQVNPVKPVFTVGPYIYYAEPVYDDLTIADIKKKFGKTLLVFPAHSYEFCGTNQDDQGFVDYVMNTVAKGYDTVLVSVYWNDVSQQIFRMFQSSGAVLVSSGFRGDSNFIRRLKTLFLIADEVCSNSFGTHIGYTLFFEKRFFYFNGNLSLQTSDKDVQKELSAIRELHRWTQGCFENNPTGKLNKEQEDRYISMWGGKEETKTPQQIQDILFIGESILQRSKGFTSMFDNIVTDMLTDHSLTDEQLRLLKISLGRKVD